MQAVLKTTELAGATLVGTLGITGSIYTGLDDETKVAPCVVIYAEDASEDFPKSGLYHVRTKVTVKEIAADTETTSSLSKTVFDAFLGSGVENNLMQSAISYSVCGVFVDGSENTQEGDAWVQNMSFDIICGLT
jgi:hypothetical protein